MRAAVIKSSRLDTVCWHPRRHMGLCRSCQQVDSCKTPEAAAAMHCILNETVERMEEAHARKMAAMRERIDEYKRRMGR